MKAKRILCLCLIFCLVLPLMSVGVFADTEFVGRSSDYGNYVEYFDNVRSNPNDTDGGSKLIYTGGASESAKAKRFYSDNKENSTDSVFDRYKPYSENGYGMEFHGAVADQRAGAWSFLLREWTYNASATNYFSIHYQVKNATNTGLQTAAGSCGNEWATSAVLTLENMEIENDVWKTYTVKLDEKLVDKDTGAKANVEHWPVTMDFWALSFPVLEGEDAYYVIDYIGFFDTEEAAENEAKCQESFYEGKPLPHPAKASVGSGYYEEAQSVELTSDTANAQIYYTLDGTTPTKASTHYTEAVSVTGSATLKTVAYDPATDRYSPVNSYVYELNLNIVAEPTFNLKGGNIPAGKSLTIATKTEGATVHYTTDGKKPTAESPVYSTPIPVTGKMTVQAIAVKAGLEDSKVAKVEFNAIIPADIYWSFAGLVAGSKNGEWQETSGVYHNDLFNALFGAGGVNDEFGAVVKSVKKDTENAIRVESYYGFGNPNVAMPNGYHRYMTLTYKCPASVQVEYHPDHYNDATREASRSQKIPLEPSETYKTVVIDLWENSDMWKDWVGDNNFTLQFYYDAGETEISILEVSFHESEEKANKTKAANPNALTPVSEKYTEEISVELKTATEGAKIYYTTDGSIPTAENGTLYTGAIEISQDTVLKVIARKDGYMDSDVKTFDYKVTLTVAQPNPSLAGGKYEGNQTVTITCTTEGAKIYYTINGSTPTAENGILYTGPITLTKSCILKVIAVMEGRTDSKVVSRTYNIVGGHANENPADTGDGNQTSQNTEPAPAKKGGCKSAVGAETLVLLGVVSLAGALVRGKRKQDD